MIVRNRLETKRKTKGEVLTVNPDTPTLDMMQTMIEKKVRCLPVLDKKGELVGIVDDKDIFRAVHRDHETFSQKTAKDLMTSDLLIGLPDDDMNYIAGLMTKNNIRYVPIMEEGKMIGLISRGDVLEAQRRHIMIENRYLKLYMEGTQLG